MCWRRLIGLGLSLLVVHLLAEPIGVWWSYAIGLSIGIGWNAHAVGSAAVAAPAGVRRHFFSVSASFAFSR